MVQLYGQKLFENASDSAVIRGSNCAPKGYLKHRRKCPKCAWQTEYDTDKYCGKCGTALKTDGKIKHQYRKLNNCPNTVCSAKVQAGNRFCGVCGTQVEHGVDTDTQERLPGGICAGISDAWTVGACMGVEGAVDCDAFEDHFMSVLRFQGAYSKDLDSEMAGAAGGDWKLNGRFRFRHERRISELMYRCDKALAVVFQTKFTHYYQVGDQLPEGNWAGYLAVWGHAIAIGRHDNAYLIMEPNAGLFRYDDKSSFDMDLAHLISARQSTWHKKHARVLCQNCQHMDDGKKKELKFCSQCGSRSLLNMLRKPPEQPITVFKAAAGSAPGVHRRL